MFRIKICGVTTPTDALAIREAGADAIGLNLYPKSPRCVSTDQITEIRLAMGPLMTCVGVFVNETALAITDWRRQFGAGSTFVQLHGDEPPAQLAEMDADAPIIRARRIGAGGLAEVASDIDECRAAGRAPDAVLVDARVPGEYGGTGQTVDWSRLAGFRETLGQTPLILAGGLTPDNVAEAIRTIRPDGVDTASGVESAPGKKDAGAVRAFVQAAREAFG